MDNVSLKLLRDMCILYMQFKFKKTGVFIDEMKGVYNGIFNSIEEAYKKKDVRKLNILKSEMEQHVKHMSDTDFEEFQNLIKQQLDIKINRNNLESKFKKKILALLKKGKVTSREEYEIVTARIDELDVMKEDELREIERLEQLRETYTEANK